MNNSRALELAKSESHASSDANQPFQAESLDRITHLTAEVIGVPICLLSIIDETPIRFRSVYGMHPESLPLSDGLCSLAIRAEKTIVLEDVLAKPEYANAGLTVNGRQLRFYAAVPLRFADGRAMGTLCVMDNEPRRLSNKQRSLLEEFGLVAQDAARMNLELQLIGRRQNEMLRTVAHELKNPIASIRLSAEILMDGGETEEEVKRIGNIIERSATRMSKLVNELLDSAKYKVAQISLDIRPVDLNAVISKVTASHLSTASAKSQKIFVEADCNPVVNGDELRLSEIVDNLVSNAIKYSPEGSDITVSLNKNQQKARLAVTDEGPGVTEGDLEKMFLPFTRLSAVPTAGEVSTGLGLSIVKTLVEAHHGRIRVENNKTRGASFIVELEATEFL